uniref:Daf-3 n=1 Tax=Pristionchus pacificus TaxID=54126 RepID=A0A2A6BIH3_PRIPA|eukprot:PDM65692.1 daf-3 [Pristionchus pacificus]
MDYSNGYPILGPSTSTGVIEHTSQNGAGPSTVPYLSPTSQQRVVNGECSGAPTLPMPFYFSPPGASGFNGQPVSGMANGRILSTSSSSPAKAIVIPGTEGRSVMRPDPKASGAEIVAYLMTFNIQTTEAEIEFSSKALESLHKKIKDKPKEMETFMRCVETKGEEVGGCVTVTRTLDGRLQVAGAKGFPHVIYNKIFRFQQIHKNELRSIPSCRYGFENKSENEDLLSDAQVCVNPYHYEKPAPAPPATSAPLWDPLTGQMRINGMPIGHEPCVNQLIM